MHPVLFKVGPVTIYTYGVLVFLGVLVGYLFALREAKRKGIDSKIFSDIIFWSLVSGFLGARVFYILVEFKQFIYHPITVGLGRGGFVFYGGVIFGLLLFYLLAKKHRLDFLKLADVATLAIPLGHAIGRLGCFFYGCCYGKPTSSWIGIKFPPNSPAGLLGEKVIPTQLISSFFLLVIFFILLLIRRKQKFRGQVVFSYFILYGIFRFIIEFYRADPRGVIGIFSTSQIIALIIVPVSIFCYLMNIFRKET
jgi:phosphatidylglycerol:prolipoprotein diacylglycerol transferase